MELTVDLDSLWWAFGLQHQLSRALQDIILHQATDLCEILGLRVQGQTRILRSTWEHAIGDERGLVRLQAHIIELHNIRSNSRFALTFPYGL